MTCAKVCETVPDGVLNVHVTVPSALAAIAVSRQLKLIGDTGATVCRRLAIAMGSCWLPPMMWKRSSETPYQSNAPTEAWAGMYASGYSMLSALCCGVSSPYLLLYAVSSRAPT